jgi:xanthine dehydrogenase YagR molybdenum-binding subunit
MFAADHVIPDLAYAVLVQSEIPHGAVHASEVDAAIKVASVAPGVLYILSPENCPPLKELPKELPADLPLERRPPLSDFTVQHVGQHLALVVTDSLENATHAASLMHFRYEREPAILSAVQALNAPVTPSADEESVRQGSYFPDHFVKLTEEKLQEAAGHSLPWEGPHMAGAARVPRLPRPA